MSIKNFRERSPVLIGIASIIGITLFMSVAFYIDRLPFINQSYEIKAEFANAAGIRRENQVRVAGIKVGQVKSIEIDGTKVVVTLEIENGIEIPQDAGAQIKLATLLGTKFVAIKGTGGSGPFMEDGATIPLERTSVPYEIYQASKEGTGVLEDLDGDALNNLLVKLTEVVRGARSEVGHALEGLNELGGQLNAKEADFRALMAGADDLTKLLSDEGDEIVQLIDSSNDVLGALAQQREEIQSLLESAKVMSAELTAVLRENRGNVDSILADLDSALRVLEGNIEDIDMALKYAGPSSKYFARNFTQGRWGDIYTCVLIIPASCELDESSP
jgi:phospholipid/cholesterol/gamma-HCH transport system substrate-binding protein